MSKKCILILSGGNIRGAWQAGVIKAILNAGYEPQYIYGTSVGALNGVILDKFRRTYVNWKDIGHLLYEYWFNTVKSPKDFVTEKSTIQLAWSVLRNKWDGFVDLTPLHKQIDKFKNFDDTSISTSTFVGITNPSSGRALLGKSIDSVKGSIAEPISFPMHKTRIDGGVQDFIPHPFVLAELTQKEIEEIDRIFVIATLPYWLGQTGPGFHLGKITHLLIRVTRLMTHAAMHSTMNLYNKTYGNLVTCIFPKEEIPVSLRNFTSQDILNMLETGYKDGLSHL